jgi:predicted SprT family Zn-dependent metalloprotease
MIPAKIFQLQTIEQLYNYCCKCGYCYELRQKELKTSKGVLEKLICPKCKGIMELKK